MEGWICLAMQTSYPFSKAPGLALALRTASFNSDLYFNMYSSSSKTNGDSSVKIIINSIPEYFYAYLKQKSILSLKG